MRDANHLAYVRGARQIKRGEFADALNSFRIALEEWPEDWQAMASLGYCHSELGKPRKAEACYREALLLAPENERPDLLYNLGNALFDQGRFAEAIEHYRQVPRGHKTWPFAKRNIAVSERRSCNDAMPVGRSVQQVATVPIPRRDACSAHDK